MLLKKLVTNLVKILQSPSTCAASEFYNEEDKTYDLRWSTGEEFSTLLTSLTYLEGIS
jgi:hypothetical protein